MLRGRDAFINERGDIVTRQERTRDERMSNIEQNLEEISQALASFVNQPVMIERALNQPLISSSQLILEQIVTSQDVSNPQQDQENNNDQIVNQIVELVQKDGKFRK